MKPFATLLCSMSLVMILSGCSLNPRSNDDSVTLLAVPQQIDATLNDLQIQWTKAFAEDELEYADSLGGYDSGDVVLIHIKSGPTTITGVVLFKNINSISFLLQQLQDAQCEFSSGNGIMISQPNPIYQKQIDLIVQKVAQSSQSSLTTGENEIYSKLIYPCPYSVGEFKALDTRLIWYRNPKNGGGNSSYINKIIPQQ